MSNAPTVRFTWGY